MKKIDLSLLFSLSLLLPLSPILGAWEDTGAPVRTAPGSSYAAPATSRPLPATRPQPQPQQRLPARPLPTQPTPLVPPQPAAGQWQPAAAQSMMPPDIYSPFLDANLEPRNWLSFAYISAADLSGSSKDLAMGELEGRFKLADWRNLLSGDMEISLRLHTQFFGGDGGFETMPTALLALPLEVLWSWRFLDGNSLQIGALPGIYSDVEALGGGMFGIPLRLTWYNCVSPTLSVMAGIEARPSWDTVVMPRLGIAWQPSDFWHIEIAVPNSLIQCNLGPLSLFGAFAWRNTTYAMSGDDGEPDDLTVEDFALSGGIKIRFSDELNLRAEIGMLTGRTLTADGAGGKSELDIDNAPFIRLSFGGAF